MRAGNTISIIHGDTAYRLKVIATYTAPTHTYYQLTTIDPPTYELHVYVQQNKPSANPPSKYSKLFGTLWRSVAQLTRTGRPTP